MKETSVTTCPICGRAASAKTRPFCSIRCADVDLGRWLTGSYAIPVPEDEADDEEAGAPRERLAGHGGTA